MDLRNKNFIEVNVEAQFSSKVTELLDLPPDLLDTDETQALATVAALLSRPNISAPEGGRYLISEDSLATRLLAFYAAGARIELTRQQYRLLDRQTSAFARTCDNEELREYVQFVRRRAFDAFRTARPGSGAAIDLDSGRGYRDLAAGLPADFDSLSSRTRLLTIAALFAAAKPSHCHFGAEAVLMVALYGAGARISLSKQQFRVLERRVRAYAGVMLAREFVAYGNRHFAFESLHHARRRAWRSGVIGSTTETAA